MSCRVESSDQAYSISTSTKTVRAILHTHKNKAASFPTGPDRERIVYTELREFLSLDVYYLSPFRFTLTTSTALSRSSAHRAIVFEYLTIFPTCPIVFIPYPYFDCALFPIEKCLLADVMGALAPCAAS